MRRSGAGCLAGGGLVVLVVLMAAASLLAGREDIAQQCPPLAHPPVLTVAAATNPCQAIYQRSAPFAPDRLTHYPLQCGNVRAGHLLDTLCPRDAVTTATQ